MKNLLKIDPREIVSLDSIPLYADDPRVRANSSVCATGPVVPFPATPEGALVAGDVASLSAAADAPWLDEMRRRLGISDTVWRRHNAPAATPGVRAFAAGDVLSADDIQAWNEFANRLIAAGVNPDLVMHSDDLFFQVVRAPRNSPYDKEPPGQYEGAPLDIEKAQLAMKAVLGLDDASEDPMEKEQAGEVWEALMQLDRFILEQEHGQNRTDYGNMPFRHRSRKCCALLSLLRACTGPRSGTGKNASSSTCFFRPETKPRRPAEQRWPTRKHCLPSRR